MKNKSRSTVNKINIVISIIIAFASWIYVVYYFTPMKDVTYKDIPINFVGVEELEYQGLEVKNTEEKTIEIDLSIRRTDYTKIKNEDIQVNADVSKAIEGNNGISLDIITPDGSIIKKISTKSVSVEVGEMKERKNESSNSKRL